MGAEDSSGPHDATFGAAHEATFGAAHATGHLPYTPPMHFDVPGSDGRPVRAVATGPDDAPTVLVAHGFKGFKDWGMFPWIGERLAEAGLRVVRFDFSHNGVEARDFDRLDLFLLDTPTRHQEDLRALADAIDGPLALLGHSRGGGDVIRFAATEPRVQAVATLASVATTAVEVPNRERILRERGYYPFPNARTKQDMPVGRHAFEDGEAHATAIHDAAAALRCPLLLIHGTADTSVPSEAQQALAAAQPAADVLTIEGAGHTFGAVHPFAGPTPHLVEAMTRLTSFLREHLGA